MMCFVSVTMMIQWALYSITIDAAIVVTVIYWAALYSKFQYNKELTFYFDKSPYVLKAVHLVATEETHVWENKNKQ